jgi:hypothetical protein
MTTFQKTALVIIIIILLEAFYIFNMQDNISTSIIEQPSTSIPTVTITPNGLCGLSITSHNINGKAGLQKPITISGIIDNTNYAEKGCAWQMFEGQAGTAQAFVFVDNSWKPISKLIPIPVSNWMTTKTTFTVELSIDTSTMNITTGTPLKVVFIEENASGEPPVDTYTLPLVGTYGELN